MGLCRDRIHYVSACVWALYGAYDHLLYDYAQKYWPNLTTDDYIDDRLFALLASSTENEDARKFLEWHRDVHGRIVKNKDAETILRVRQVEAHRGSAGYSFYALWDMPSLHDVVTASGAVTMEPSQLGSTHPTVKHPILRSAINFEGYPSKSVEQVIESALGLMNEIVTEAENKFDLPNPRGEKT